MDSKKYRVENKRNVQANGRRTSFTLYAFDQKQAAYVHAGQFTAMGWDQPDEKCISAALETIERQEGGSN